MSPTMIPNPFDSLAEQLAALTAKVDALNAKVSSPKPEWEPIADAIATRRKARRTLMAAVRADAIRHKKSVNRLGRESLLLSVADLDQYYPKRAS